MTRRYYQLLDFTQRSWLRFRDTEVGRAVIWLVPRLLRWSWVAMKVMMASFAVFVMFSYAAMVFMLLVLTGNGGKALDSFTKITVVALGLFAASRLVKKKKLAVADVVKAVTP